MGSPGVGKTYFCSAMIPWIYQKVRFFRYWTERDLLSKIRSSLDLAQSDYLKTLLYYTDDDFLMIDDIASSGMNDWRREVIFELIDQRYESQKPTIFTTNLTPLEVKEQLGARSHSRLFSKENTILDLHGFPDLRQIYGPTETTRIV